MTHDPLCDYAHVAGGCESCDLIARVREDERARLPENGADATWYLLGQRKGRADAARDVAALLRSWGRVTDPDAQELLVTAARGGTDE